MRLIDADELIADSCRDCPEEIRKLCKTEPACADMKFLFGAPTVDAVPVVRCKDCKYIADAVVNANGFLICDISDMEIAPKDFCSYGERRGGGEDG